MCLGRVPETGDYRVFLVAIEGFVYQMVDRTPQCIQIMSGKCDQMRPNFEERDQMRLKTLIFVCKNQNYQDLYNR